MQKMTPIFHVIEHVTFGQHIREYPNANKHRQEAALKLSIKQYTPLDTSALNLVHAITIIVAGANGFPKVVHEL